jgi:UDP-N-acetylmuramate--alanine ligase
VAFEPTWSSVAGAVASRAVAGDLVVTMGAGDVTLLGPEVLALLQERAS